MRRTEDEAARRPRLPTTGAEFVAAARAGRYDHLVDRRPTPDRRLLLWYSVVRAGLHAQSGRRVACLTVSTAVVLAAVYTVVLVLPTAHIGRSEPGPQLAAPAPGYDPPVGHAAGDPDAGSTDTGSTESAMADPVAVGGGSGQPEPVTLRSSASDEAVSVPAAGPPVLGAMSVDRFPATVGDRVELQVGDVRTDAVVLESTDDRMTLEAGVDVGDQLSPDATYPVEVRGDDRSVVRSAVVTRAVDGAGVRMDVDLR